MSDESASAPADVSPGDKIAGYRLEEQIGQGGMAVVYRAHDERLDRLVALKLLAPALAADTAFRTRFIRESRAAAAVDHPNIIPVYDAGDAGGCLFISMRYVQGGDVRSLLGDAGPLAPARAWHIISQVAAALDAAHAHGLVHRDVKPANMLLDAGGRTSTGKGADAAADPHDHVYLSDFGISKRTLASNLTSTGQFLGTLDYIAPEQVEGHAIDGRADQYSLACAAFELLCGAPPFRRSTGLAVISAHLTEPPPSLAARRTELGSRVDAVLAKAMAKSPNQRYASCEQFAADLGRGLGLVAGPPEAMFTPDAGQPDAKPWPATQLAEPAPAAPVDPAPAAPAGPGGPVPFDPSTMPAGQQGAQSGEARATGQPAAWAQQPRQTWPDQAGGGYGGGQYPPQQQFRQPTGQNVPGWQQGPPPARKSRGLLVGIGAGVLVVAVGAGVGAVIYAGQNKVPPPHGHGTSPPASSPAASSPAKSARAQATAISNLLSTSRVTRGMLQPAVSDIQANCSTLTPAQLASDVATIKTVADQRQSEYSQAFGLQVGALANGSQLKNGLLDALQASLNADNDYLRWGRQEQGGCFPATQSAAFNQAGQYDIQAASAKSTFATEWNPVAAQYGLPTVSQGDI